MPTVRKITPPDAAPAPLDLPPELAGWRWSTNPKTGHYFLMHPKHPATFTTRHYSDPADAIGEARRWVLSQPKARPSEPAAIDLALVSLRASGYTIQPHGLHWTVRENGGDPTGE